MTTSRLGARFWPKVGPPTPNGCREWRAYRDSRGYGSFGLSRGNTEWAHRVAWTLVHGPIPDGFFVCHRCDNPPCCEPTHLFLGTPAENTADMDRKGRGVRPRLTGEQNPRAKLTAQEVREIRLRVEGGDTRKQLAQEYGVSDVLIGKIVNGRLWKGAA